MTIKEKNVIRAREVALWNEMSEYNYFYAIMNLPTNMSYQEVLSILNELSYSKVITARWNEVYTLMEAFNIECDYDSRNNYYRMLWQLYHAE